MLPELIGSFDLTVAFLEQQVADLSDEDMIAQPPGVPNHAVWTLGHIIHSCQAMALELGVESWLPSDWEGRFGYGSVPSSRHSDQLSKKALLGALTEASRRLRTALAELDEKALADPLPDEEARRTFPTKGHALLQVVAAHTAFHAGQLAAWRRAIGRGPVGPFV
jgi:uncharacterized damage-inducible protein DinB